MAGIGVGILPVPLVASVAEDAMRAVPRACGRPRTASAPAGHNGSCKVVFPAAISGIVAALILATSRAIGETMVVAVAAGAPQARTVNPLDPGGTMTSAMVHAGRRQLDEVTGNSAAFQSLFFVGLLPVPRDLRAQISATLRPPRPTALLGGGTDVDHPDPPRVGAA